MDKSLENQLRSYLSVDAFKEGKKWKEYTVYVPVYKQEHCGGLPRVVLEKDGAFRLSTHEECFEYMKFIKDKK